MRKLPALVLLTTLALSATGGETPPRTPVLVELFTSEGCSTCPPVDRLLARLAAEQPIEDVQIVPLEFHVDYWDRLGWKDPFSSAAFTKRQGDYSRTFGGENYTPQVIVDGSEFVGDERAIRAAIATAAKESRALVRIERAGPTGAETRIALQVSAVAKGADAEVFLAITEDQLAMVVARGENAGKRLEHAATVRDFRRIGRLDASGRFDGAPALARDPVWKAGALHAVVFVQERGSRHVLGAARISL